MLNITEITEELEHYEKELSIYEVITTEKRDYLLLFIAGYLKIISKCLVLFLIRQKEK